MFSHISVARICRAVLFVHLGFVVLCMFAFGCYTSVGFTDDALLEDGADSSGSSRSVFTPPFSPVRDFTCASGPEGNNHAMPATDDGVDWQIPEGSWEPVFAPFAGTVFVPEFSSEELGACVHLKNETPGTFLALCNMDEIVVSTGDTVSDGTFLGMTGSVGTLHMSLMEGSPALSTEESVSIPIDVRLYDESAEGVVSLHAEDIPCGATSMSTYRSVLSPVTTHPDGTVLQVPGGQNIYVQDRGFLSRIEGADVFESYGFDVTHIVPMSPYEQECFPAGQVITEPACYDSVRDEYGQVWMTTGCQEDPARVRRPMFPQLRPAIVMSWNLPEPYEADTEWGSVLMDYPIDPAWATLRDGTLVREGSSEALYVVNDGVALPFEDALVAPSMLLTHLPHIVVPNGTLAYGVLGVGNCAADVGCVRASDVHQCIAFSSESVPTGNASPWSDPSATSDDEEIIPSEEEEEEETPPSPLRRTLTLDYAPPAVLGSVEYIELSGEYTLADGSMGFLWTEPLEIIYDTVGLTWSLENVQEGDTFRFSLEFYDWETNYLNWACTPPAPYNTQGTLTADVDGAPIPIHLIDNTLGGCEDLLYIP